MVVAALPGTFATPERALAYIQWPTEGDDKPDIEPVIEAFQIGVDRLFDDDPRFGLVVLSEIAGRALSPAVNDPGTAIDIIGTLVRLFVLWSECEPDSDEPKVTFDRVEVPEILVRDMFDDAFTAIARDGAEVVEVSVRLQKALRSLAALNDADIQAAAEHHAKLAAERSQRAMKIAEDRAAVLAATPSAGRPGPPGA